MLGSRGCTAAVVELVYNTSLLQPNQAESNSNSEVSVYRGEVEFMKLEDWTRELKILVNECSTQEKNIYALVPDENRQPDAGM